MTHTGVTTRRPSALQLVHDAPSRRASIIGAGWCCV
jgi:hypothetical protein